MSTPPPLRVAVIGAGPAGLVTLKYLTTAHLHFPTLAPIDARLFEASDSLGGAFASSMYEDAEMVSSKQLTAFSDFRLPAHEPDFISAERYREYLTEYAKKFGLEGRIRCRTRVTDVVQEKCESGGMVITGTTTHGQEECEWEWKCDAVAVCTGLNNTPYIPNLQGAEAVAMSLHSKYVKTRGQFPEDGTVVVLGTGETGLDMAWLAVTSRARRVILCHRDGFFCGPKIIPTPTVLGRPPPSSTKPNKPVDCATASLFDTAYVPPVLQRGPLLWWYYNAWIRAMLTLIGGTHAGPDQWVGEMPEERRHVNSLFFVKSTHALPYLSTGHRSPSLLNRIRSRIINVPTTDTTPRHIETAPWPSSISTHDSALHFSPETLRPDEHASVAHSPVHADMLVWATGYVPTFAKELGLDGASVRGIHAPGEEGVRVGFIGFVRPSIGAIPPLAELQAQLWLLHLLEHLRPTTVPPRTTNESFPTYDLDYALHPRTFPSSSSSPRTVNMATTKRGVDHESYAYQLALDIGAAPTFTHVARNHGWRALLVWAMGPTFTTKMRMVGPFKMNKEELVPILEGELWDVTKRTGGMVFFLTYTIVPMVVFGALSMAMWGAMAVGRGVKTLWRRLRGKHYLCDPRRPE